LVNSLFVKKKINQLTTSIAQASATISDLQIQLATYWSQNIADTMLSLNTSLNTNTNANRLRESSDRLERIILNYIHHCTQHVRKSAQNKIKIATAQKNEYKALEEFENLATPVQCNMHSMLKPKMKKWQTKKKIIRQQRNVLNIIYLQILFQKLILHLK